MRLLELLVHFRSLAADPEFTYLGATRFQTRASGDVLALRRQEAYTVWYRWHSFYCFTFSLKSQGLKLWWKLSVPVAGGSALASTCYHPRIPPLPAAPPLESTLLVSKCCILFLLSGHTPAGDRKADLCQSCVSGSVYTCTSQTLAGTCIVWWCSPALCFALELPAPCSACCLHCKWEETFLSWECSLT